jgi:hypothetical protein
MIWNRACSDPLRSRPGDRALADMLLAHGLVMNGGVLHATECLSDEDLSDAISGFKFYGLDEVASVLLTGKEVLKMDTDIETEEGRLDDQYTALVPDDNSLVARFERHFQLHPADYESI